MKKGWEYIDFKDVFPVKMGKTPPRGDKSSWDEKKETHNKWVSIADISNNEGKIIKDTKEYISDSAAEKINKVSKGSLLMSFKLSIGRMAFAGDDLYTNEAIIAIPENEKYILRFIYYYLLSYDWLSLTEGNEKVKGATLNKTSIGKIQLPVLSLIEQQAIVDYLDSAFAKIDAMKANAEKALNEAKALFQASLKEMLEPKEGWEESELKDIVDEKCPISYGIVQQGDHVEGGIPVVRPVDLNRKYITANDLKCTTESISSSYKRTILRGDEILLGVRGTTGIIGIATEELNGCNVNRGVVPLFFKDTICRDFIFYEMLSPAIQAVFAEKTTGATLKQINIKDLRTIVFSYPIIEIQQSIVATLDSLKSKVDRLQENYDKISLECDALKQAILRQVFE